jgi:hypothetical protein
LRGERRGRRGKMIELRPAPLAEVRPPVSKYLQQNYLVRFTDQWPTTKAVSGKLFEIKRTNQVPYVRRFILPTGDYRDVDLSNGTGTFQESLYPTSDKSLFEISFGWKPGNYLIHIYVPATKPISQLEFSGMTPVLTDVNRRYLGARKPDDSPFDDHRAFIYAVNAMDPIILEHYVLPGVAFEKCICGIMVNKCLLSNPITNPTDEQLKKSKEIPYWDELKW